ncbi:MAG: hypothetical protein J7L89_03805, partial [Bacteroidales bacterium]|nr:hypothetical protein [Bacteroidales bacterium]
SIGTTNYLGDVGGSSDHLGGFVALFDNLGVDPMNTRLAIEIGSRYVFKKNLAISLYASPMLYYGSDLNSSKEARGYYFDTYIFELGSHFEYYFANRMTGFAPYGFAGLGGLLYWVNANHTSDPIKTRMANDLMFGIGTRFASKHKLTHSLELGFHYYLTDYIDGLPGYLKRNDTGFTLLYSISFEWVANFIYDYRGLIRD